ncbi:MAG TPA: ABC transporter permease, partial [Chloroflexota bacterium]|nr:ABC transporter permease [Chloroflexota bacterium]
MSTAIDPRGALVLAQPEVRAGGRLTVEAGWSARLGRFMARKRLGAVGGAIVVVLLLVALAAPWLAPYSYEAGVADERLQGPSLRHAFGTDANGRDMLSRIIWGARISV